MILVSATRLDIDLRPFFGGSLDCRLFVKPSFFQFHTTSAAGTYTWGHAVPSTHIGLTHAQIAELRSDGTVLTTNGLALACQ